MTTPEIQHQLAQKYWRGRTNGGRPLSWGDMSSSEQDASMAEWRAQQEERTASPARDNASTSRGEIAATLAKAIDFRIVQYLKKLPKLLERDLSSLVSKAYLNESRALDERTSTLVTRVTERLDVMAGSIANLNGQAHRLSALDLFTAEQNKRLAELEAKVAALTVQVQAQAKGRGDGLH